MGQHGEASHIGARYGNGTRHRLGRSRPPGKSQNEIVGRSPALMAAVETALRVAPTHLPVLIVGETGTGKELMARLLHGASERTGEFVDVDCGALPEELIEALLFGHRRGAFTGAIEHAQGMIERAEGGTLFLDELGSLPVRGQAKLLRVLETRQLRRVGSTRARTIDFRIVATTQEDVGDLVSRRRLRLDLLQRIAGVVIRLPSLDDRPSDVIPLARHFAGERGARMDGEAESLIRTLSWPGNVRQLRWAVERAAVFASDGHIDASALREALEAGPSTLYASGTAAETGLAELKAACRAHRGNPSEIARALRVSRPTLYRRLRAAGIDLKMYR